MSISLDTSIGNGPPTDSPTSPSQHAPAPNAASMPSTAPGSPRTPSLVYDSSVPDESPNHQLDMSGPSNDRHFLPIPKSPPNHSQSSVYLSDVASALSSEGIAEGVALPEEFANAGLSIAPDGTFVETTSAHAARELKRRYDQMLGVGKNGVRSPYAITAYKSPDGQDLFRVSERPPVPVKQTPEPRPSQSQSQSTRERRSRRPRLSVGGLLPPLFKNTEGNSSTATLTTKAPKSSSLSKLSRRGRQDPPHAEADEHGALFTSPTRSEPSSELSEGIPQPLGLVSPSSGTSTTAQSPLQQSTGLPSVQVYYQEPQADVLATMLGWPTPMLSLSIPGEKTFSPSDPAQPAAQSIDEDNISTPNAAVAQGKVLPVVPGIESSVKGGPTFPFGEGVEFESPIPRLSVDLGLEFGAEPTRHMLRGVQSFESGLTARISHFNSSTSQESPRESDEDTPMSGIGELSEQSNELFDILQTYRGIPLLELLSEHSVEATVKLSVTSSAAPKDDPRFVIWGEINSHTEDHTRPRGDSVSSSSTSRKKHYRGRSASVSLPSEQPQRLIVAATLERWIAQLTSELNYDELLHFFLTYRYYMRAVDLCRLLACRFQWALTTDAADETVKKIVRVRTFIAIRFWLSTFFREDFIENKELCVVFTTWLNGLKDEPAIQANPDALNIVRKLKKTVRECKATFMRPKGYYANDLRQSYESTIARQRAYTLGGPVSPSDATLMNTMGISPPSPGDREDADVDLDLTSPILISAPPLFIPTGHGGSIRARAVSDGAALALRAHADSNTAGFASTAPAQVLLQPLPPRVTGKPALPSTSVKGPLPMPHNAISRAFVSTVGRLGRLKRVIHNRSNVPGPDGSEDISAFDLELTASGELLTVRGGVEQYLKLLNAQNSEAKDEEIVESANDHKVEVEKIPEEAMVVEPSEVPVPQQVLAVRDPTTVPLPKDTSPERDTPEEPDFALEPEVEPVSEAVIEQPPLQDAELEDHELRRSRALSADYDSVMSREGSDDFMPHQRVTSADYDSIMSREDRAFESQRADFPEIVSLDDFDLSDSDSEMPAAGPRRLPRRLPNRRDFEFVRRSQASVSSLGIRSSDERSSYASMSAASDVSTHTDDYGDALNPKEIKSWQIDLIESEDDEPGDADAALRRLEGQIDSDRQRLKSVKVDGWMKAVAERLNADLTGGRRFGFQDFATDETQEIRDDAQNEGSDDGMDVNGPMEDLTISVSASSASRDSSQLSPPASSEEQLLLTPSQPETLTVTADERDAGAVTPTPPDNSFTPALSPVEAELSALEPARKITSPKPDKNLTRKSSFLDSVRKPPRVPAPSGRFTTAASLPIHRSFIMNYRTQALAEHFTMIARELFLAVKFDHLLSHDWTKPLPQLTVLDWAQFLKDRQRLRVAQRKLDVREQVVISDISAMHARFNLLVKFIGSEIVLTHPTERPALFNKIIRVAWKLYLQNNFSSLVAVITGLQTLAVQTAMRRVWNRVGMFEMRMYNEFVLWTSPNENFKIVRDATTALLESQPLKSPVDISSASSQSGSSVSGRESDAPKVGCVAFLGPLLGLLANLATLPDFVDPTAPGQPLEFDKETGTWSPPRHPEVFATLAPLPSGMSLRPLINVHKLRLISGVVKIFVAEQHLANNYRFDIDRKLYQKCLRMRALDDKTMMQFAQAQ